MSTFSNTAFIEPTSTVDLNQMMKIFCLPNRQLCHNNSKDGLLVDCADRWNCQSRCDSDPLYYIPVLSTDKIQIQTLFYNFTGDNQNPAPFPSWINARLCYGENESMDLSSFVSRTMSAYGSDRPFQIIELDISLIADEVTCFFIEFENLTDGSENAICCTQEFKILDESCMEATVLLQGKRTEGTDCFGYCYGEPDSYSGDLIEYDNRLRYYGYLKSGDGSVSFESINDDIISSETILDEYILRLNAMAPFAKTILLRQLLSSGTICINEEE